MKTKKKTEPVYIIIFQYAWIVISDNQEYVPVVQYF